MKRTNWMFDIAAVIGIVVIMACIGVAAFAGSNTQAGHVPYDEHKSDYCDDAHYVATGVCFNCGLQNYYTISKGIRVDGHYAVIKCWNCEVLNCVPPQYGQMRDPYATE